MTTFGRSDVFNDLQIELQFVVFAVCVKIHNRLFVVVPGPVWHTNPTEAGPARKGDACQLQGDHGKSAGEAA